MQQHEQAQFLRAVGLFVAETVKTATAPLLDKITFLENELKKLNEGCLHDFQAVRDTFKSYASEDRVKELIMGRLKEDLELGALADFDDVVSTCGGNARAIVKEELSKIEVIHGKDGKDGESVSLEDLKMALLPGIQEFLRSIPPAKDGEPGKDGKDGTSISLDDVLSGVRGLVAEAVDALPVPRSVVGAVIDRDGDLCLVLSDGESKKLGKVVGNDGLPGKDGKDGRPGENGKDGKDGIGFKDMSVTFDGERDFAFKFVLEDRVEELKMTIPFVLYRGVWRPGSYKQGDQVTRDGSQFVAMRDTDGQPGTAESGWQLSTKRGRDGKDGDAGPPGPPGPPGKNGRDLTQIGPDGKKWG
jgi:integrin beta 3